MRVFKQRMVEIDIRSNQQPFLNIRQTFLYVLITLFLPLLSFSQPKEQTSKSRKKIEIIHTDRLETDNKMGSDFRRLIGNDTIKHNDILMYCDSAHVYQNTKRVWAFGKVHIKQGDTLDLYGNYLFYDGVEEKAIVEGNVELIDKETHLYTKALKYDVANKIASYTDSGRIINAKNKLTSRIGFYYASQKMFHFKDSVKIVNPEYVISADTMDYNTETETTYFNGPSEVKGDSIYIYCEKGWYDTKKDVSRIWKNSVIDNKKQIIRGDSLYYDKISGFGQAFGNISIADTSNDVVVTGNLAWYYKKPEEFMVTDKAVFIQISNKDSLFLHADTISAVTVYDSARTSFRLIRAYRECRIFSSDLQAKCDSLSYSFQDSVIRLYYSPVLWSEENQLTSDSIAIFTKNRQVDLMELYNSAFITSQVDSIRFNQIKGRNLKGYFRNNKMYKIRIDGNGETIYFLVDKGGLIGVNHAKSSSIEIDVEEGKITGIIEFQNPDGTLNPPMKEPAQKQRLPGFNWLDLLRPKNKSDIFRKK
jgi:lipopolysaccharide assembly outer membrane protein LptD (OstA)